MGYFIEVINAFLQFFEPLVCNCRAAKPCARKKRNSLKQNLQPRATHFQCRNSLLTSIEVVINILGHLVDVRYVQQQTKLKTYFMKKKTYYYNFEKIILIPLTILSPC